MTFLLTSSWSQAPSSPDSADGLRRRVNANDLEASGGDATDLSFSICWSLELMPGCILFELDSNLYIKTIIISCMYIYIYILYTFLDGGFLVTRWTKKGWVGPLHWRVKQNNVQWWKLHQKNPLPYPWFSALLILYCTRERNIRVFNQSQSYHRITMKCRNSLESARLCHVRLSGQATFASCSSESRKGSNLIIFTVQPKKCWMAFLATCKIELMDNLLNKLKMIDNYDAFQ